MDENMNMGFPNQIGSTSSTYRLTLRSAAFQKKDEERRSVREGIFPEKGTEIFLSLAMAGS